MSLTNNHQCCPLALRTVCLPDNFISTSEFRVVSDLDSDQMNIALLVSLLQNGANYLQIDPT